MEFAISASQVVGFVVSGAVMLLQWSLGRNLKHLDSAVAASAQASVSTRSELLAEIRNVQGAVQTLSAQGMVMARDVGQLTATHAKLEERQDKLADHWQRRFAEQEEKFNSRLEKAVSDVLETIAEVKNHARSDRG